uniref:Uncharacterized protein n=1 Tax=Panagrolaimus davidi TaxID=227884 RepID=A0A914PCP2_9BILA
MFKCKFYSQKNILFVFGENKYQDFALVFKNEIKCKKVYDLIYLKKAKDEITNEQIYRRILFQILKQITKVANISLSELLKKWMNKLENNDKKFYYQMLKDDEIYDLIYPNDERHNEKNDQNEVTSYRKRFPETIENSGEYLSVSQVTG